MIPSDLISMQAVHDWRPVELLDPLTITQADSAGKVSSLTLSYAEDQVLPGAHNPFSETEPRVGAPAEPFCTSAMDWHLGNGRISLPCVATQIFDGRMEITGVPRVSRMISPRAGLGAHSTFSISMRKLSGSDSATLKAL